MVIGFFLALVFFAPLSYALARAITRYSQNTNSPLLGALYQFLGQLTALSLLSLALMAAASVLGFSASVAVDALVSTVAKDVQPGVVSALGALVVAMWGLAGVMLGPASAFLAAKIIGITALVAALVKVDQSKVRTWVPILAAGTALFSMWPFTAYLTFGL